MRLSRRLLPSAAAVMLLAGIAPVSVAAITPTVGQTKDAYAREMTLIFEGIADPAGTRTVWVSCDAGSHRSDPYPFAARLLVSLELPGCEGYGLKYVDVQVEEADHTPVFWGQVGAGISPKLTLGTPLPAVTGRAFTFDPEYPADYDLPADALCRWEFRWGNDRSLIDNDYDETFGALGFDTPSVNGDCPTWTFTLPWVPYPRFELYLNVGLMDNGERAWVEGAHVFVKAAVNGTGPRITDSNLPLAQVLPSTYTPIVGQPITYTRYLIGGAAAGTSSRWTARLGGGDHPTQWIQEGGSTFTITPRDPGNVVVGWQRFSGMFLYALFDPPVRYRDYYRPNTTAPVQVIGAGTLGNQVPVTLTWTGTDRGWGIDRYQLDRSVDGGAWSRVISIRSRTYSQLLDAGHTFRYRVRAIDKYGNTGYWDVGPSFRPTVVCDATTAVVYSGAWTVVPDAAARGGSLHETEAIWARATFTFTGRDLAWVAERGPNHGVAKVYLDGTYVGAVDLFATVEIARQIVFRHHWTAVGVHAIRIVDQGTVGRPAVDIDAFLTLR